MGKTVIRAQVTGLEARRLQARRGVLRETAEDDLFETFYGHGVFFFLF